MLINNGPSTRNEEDKRQRRVIHRRERIPGILAGIAYATSPILDMSGNGGGINPDATPMKETGVDSTPGTEKCEENAGTGKYLDILNCGLPLKSAVFLDTIPNKKRREFASEDNSRPANMSTQRKAAVFGHQPLRRKNTRDYMKEIEEIHEAYGQLFDEFRHGSNDLEELRLFMTESELHSAMSVLYLCNWLQYDETNETSRIYVFNNLLTQLEEAEVVTRIYLPGFGDFPVPSNLYEKIKFEIYPAWVNAQRWNCPQIENRCTLNEVSPASGGSMIGKKVQKTIQRLQASLGIFARECIEIQDHTVPERFRDSARFEKKYRVVNENAYSLDKDEDDDFDEDATISTSGLISKKDYRHKALLDVYSRKSNFVNVGYQKTAFDDDDDEEEDQNPKVRSHDIFRSNETRTHGSVGTAAGAIYNLLLEAAGSAGDTDQEYDTINGQIQKINNDRRIEEAMKEQDRIVETEQEKEDRENGIIRDTHFEDMLRAMDPWE